MATGRLTGRDGEISELRRIFEESESSLTHLTGPCGIGKSALLREAAADAVVVHLHAPPLPAPAQLEHFERELGRVGIDSAPARHPATLDPWERFCGTLRTHAEAIERPLVVVFDDAHRLSESRARLDGPLDALLRDTRRSGNPVHVVFAGPGRSLPGLPRRPAVEVGRTIRLGPLGFYDALEFLPGGSASKRLRAYSVFGGTPGVLRLVDPEASFRSNLVRLVLAPGAPLARYGLDLLERRVQVPSRYVAILSVLARGEAEWSDVHEGVPDLTRSGQVAPYISRLEELGLVGVDRSLDAGPRSRSRRYRILDPFLQFWFRFLPLEGERLMRGEGEGLGEEIREGLDDHVLTLLPSICREFMRTRGAEVVGSLAREAGGLWGPGYDIPVAGILRTGAAFYGRSYWAKSVPEDAVHELDREVRETRYGFGRERRYRMIFHRGDPLPELEREAARRENVVLVALETVMNG